ncbi:MAG: hypothetical protein GXY37_01245 [Chloroflexi bacterium]|nr:hypothetical protein [Chloroflexota bacterium]
MREDKLDSHTGRYLAEPLDTWLTASHQDYSIPEAAGSSARVFLLKHVTGHTNFRRDPAFKIMRHDKLAYAKPLFREEYKILAGLRGMSGLTNMLESGFFKPKPGSAWPPEIAPLTIPMLQQSQAVNMSGRLAVFSPEETDQVLKEFDERIEDGWLPYLILERRWEDNLYLLCDAGYTRGNFIHNLNMRQVLDISIQILKYLEKAHASGATYLDHKLLHYYWNDIRQQVIMIDWNIGHWTPENFAPEVQRADLIQFSSRALHHIFTGRQAPSSVAVGPNRPEDIANSPSHYKASYAFDIQNRLNEAEMKFLEKALDGRYQTPSEMIEDVRALQSKRP